jgi:hypothetical protein
VVPLQRNGLGSLGASFRLHPGMPRLALFGAVRPVGLGASGLPSPKNMQSGHMASFAVLALATLERNQTSIP